jgi:hypothetical protein
VCGQDGSVFSLRSGAQLGMSHARTIRRAARPCDSQPAQRPRTLHVLSQENTFSICDECARDKLPRSPNTELCAFIQGFVHTHSESSRWWFSDVGSLVLVFGDCQHVQWRTSPPRAGWYTSPISGPRSSVLPNLRL